MNSRIYSIAIVALVLLGAGAWWVTSRVETQGTANPDLFQSADTPSAVDITPSSPQATVIEGATDSGRTEEEPSVADSPALGERPEKREFESRVDSDPALSRELETAVRRSLDAKLDRSRMDLESLICRGNSCQVLLVPLSQAAGTGGMSSVSALLRDLNDAPARNPSTGTELKPTLQMMSTSRGENAGTVAVIAFESK